MRIKAIKPQQCAVVPFISLPRNGHILTLYCRQSPEVVIPFTHSKLLSATKCFMLSIHFHLKLPFESRCFTVFTFTNLVIVSWVGVWVSNYSLPYFTFRETLPYTKPFLTLSLTLHWTSPYILPYLLIRESSSCLNDVLQQTRDSPTLGSFCSSTTKETPLKSRHH